MGACSLNEVEGIRSGGGFEVGRWAAGWGWWGGKRGCLSNHIAEPVPERYRFTLTTILALLVKAEPQGGGGG